MIGGTVDSIGGRASVKVDGDCQLSSELSDVDWIFASDGSHESVAPHTIRGVRAIGWFCHWRAVAPW